MSNYLNTWSSFVILFLISYPLVAFVANRYFNHRMVTPNLTFFMAFLIYCAKMYFLDHLPVIDRVYLAMMGSAWVFLNIYILISRYSKKTKNVLGSFFERISVPILLFGVTYVIARVGHFPLKNIILGPGPDEGSHFFEPGYLNDMIWSSIFLTAFVYTGKFLYHEQLERVEKRRNEKLRKTELEKELAQAQLHALQSKVNPHFLYNSLNSIAGLALVDGEKTRQMALALSRFFRYSMNREEANLNSVEEEFETLRTYLEIEKIRFEDRLDFTINASPEVLSSRIPRMLLQPLVENCVIHGMKGDNMLQIRIYAIIDKQQLILTVSDNGAPFPDDLIPGYGLKSVYDRLDLLFPDQSQVEILNQPEKQIRIMIKYTLK